MSDVNGPPDGASGSVPCVAGHEADITDEFCPSCGAGLWTTCPDGHRTLAVNLFCGACGRPMRNNGDAAIDAVSMVLGPPDENPPAVQDPCVGMVSFPRWGELTIVILVTNLPEFIGYSYGDFERTPGEGEGTLTTAEGITAGSTLEEVRAAYPDAEVTYEEALPAYFLRIGEGDFARGLRGEMTGENAEDVVTHLASGQSGYCD